MSYLKQSLDIQMSFKRLGSRSRFIYLWAPFKCFTNDVFLLAYAL